MPGPALMAQDAENEPPRSPSMAAPAVVVTNAPVGSAAARAVMGRLTAQGPLAALVTGNAALPAGVRCLRVHPRATARNVAALRAAVRWLRGGGRLIVLRGAEAAGPLRGRMAEARWGRLVRELARVSRAPVVPAYVPVPGTLLARFWQLWLPARGVVQTGNSSGSVRFGEPLPARKLTGFDAEFEIGRYLRLRIGMLGASAQGRGVGPRHASAPRTEVAPGPDSETLATEIANLDASAHLLDSGPTSVYCAGAAEVPNVLREIGRLREVTFRAVGEGTGGNVDLDVYDEYYRHLFIWHRERREIVGGYRLGLADEILARFGKKGLYSHSLFRFRTRLIEQINPAIELGRSFVRPEYQREYTPLLLLWKGIAAFVLQHPRYRVLFGPVSISAEYETSSQQLLVDFLTINSRHSDLARHVRPKRPFRGARDAIWRRAGFTGINSIEDVSELIAQIEPDEKGVPVLLRQYLKLGGKILGFNVDDQFSDVLDGLIMVDLLEADRKVLARYLGREGAAQFHEWHRSRGTRAGAVS